MKEARGQNEGEEGQTGTQRHGYFLLSCIIQSDDEWTVLWSKVLQSEKQVVCPEQSTKGSGTLFEKEALANTTEKNKQPNLRPVDSEAPFTLIISSVSQPHAT